MEELLILLKERFATLLANTKIEYKRYFFNKVDFNDKLVGILGARGVGKTTFLLQYLKGNSLSMTEKLYVSADTIELSDVSLYEFAEFFEDAGGKLLVIDEIHKYPDFEQHLKQIYDFLGIKVVFSGSSAVILEHARTDLSRRAVIYRVNGLSFREFLELKTGERFENYSLDEILNYHEDIAYGILEKISPFKFWNEFLKKGFYPFYFENPSTYFAKLEETINAVIEADIPVIFNVSSENIRKLKGLVKLICTSEPYELNVTKLSQKIGINRNTLYRYLDYLHKGNIIFILKSIQKGDKIFVKPDKLYLNNTNLNFCFCNEQHIGTIRETFAVSMLREHFRMEYPKFGDLFVDGKYFFEIGGKNKDFSQFKGNRKNKFLLIDGIKAGSGNKIPLWLLGFLY